MKPEDVKLTSEQTTKVIIKTLDSVLPWKTFLAWLGVSLLNYYVVIPWANPIKAASEPVLMIFFAGFVFPVAELLALVFAGLMFGTAVENLHKKWKEHFDKHKEEVQKEVLSGVVEKEILR